MRLCAIGLALVLAPLAAQAEETCHEISAQAGWQEVVFPTGLVTGVRVSGHWSLADDVLEAIGAEGHFGETAKALDAEGRARLDPSAAHGALLFRVIANGRVGKGSWTLFKSTLDQTGPFRMNGGALSFRINEPDTALADNSGALQVCMSYAG